ncbi:hypothetical protein EVAR_18772_1 [Eumeta japonica]|uniref:Uncharacterized protein n=1 Tax=Eumeta variegata TaxID=151549 RepID=A0A4C1UNC6_EUMVA|nr:hypothetical protein EVAR_18772_1 [Eumeta japonica]
MEKLSYIVSKTVGSFPYSARLQRAPDDVGAQPPAATVRRSKSQGGRAWTYRNRKLPRRELGLLINFGPHETLDSRRRRRTPCSVYNLEIVVPNIPIQTIMKLHVF